MFLSKRSNGIYYLWYYDESGDKCKVSTKSHSKSEAQAFLKGFIENGKEKNPPQFNLSQNYPNPFNPVTRIDYALPARENVKLSVYNMLGQEVVKLVDEVLGAG